MTVPDYNDVNHQDEIENGKSLTATEKRPRHRRVSSSQTTSPDQSANGQNHRATTYTTVDDSSSMSLILSSPIMTKPTSTVFWNTDDLLEAAKLLTSRSEPTPISLLTDSEQMRRVFTLIFDVLRYKSVLDEALQNAKFYKKYPKWKEQKSLIWLLFYDLFKRDFQPRLSALDEKFGDHELSQADSVLWENRVKLGATLSKMRIKNKAYDLENLLPTHLQNSRTDIDDSVLCGWINYFKTTPQDVFDSLNDCGFSHLPQERDDLSNSTYKLDHLLPRYIHCRPTDREEFVNTSLFTDNNVVLQERTFCLGPAIVAQIVYDLELSGKVVQTHISSLPTIAYLANLLATNGNIDGLLVFGAGDGKHQCEEYLKGLGVNNTRVFSENFTRFSHDPTNLLENVIGVLATPPNTNSNVYDPVDLAVARGGDLSLLEQLTADTLHDTSGSGQVMGDVLIEQRNTLRVAMSKPQIQFVVYETHSRYDLENSDMAVRVMTEMNGYATEKHLEELKKSHLPVEESSQPQQDGDEAAGSVGVVGSVVSQPSQTQRQSSTDAEETLITKPPSVTVPPCDLFEMAALPDLCPQLAECLDTNEHGTYIAVLKRKEITRLDPKYMIQMAESRGLFGRKGESGRSRNMTREMRKKAAMKLQRSQSGSEVDKRDKVKIKIELSRIAAPTHSSTLRDRRNLISSIEDILCRRHVHHLSSCDGSTSDQVIESFTGPKPKRFESVFEQNRTIERLSCSKQYQNEGTFPRKRWLQDTITLFNEMKMSLIEFNSTELTGLGALVPRKLSNIVEESESIGSASSNSSNKITEFSDHISLTQYTEQNFKKRK